MIIATLLGIFTGVFLGDLCKVFAPWENAYIMILKITTIPYLICAVIHGVGRLASSMAKQIVQKGLLFIAGAWIINIGMIYLSVYLFPGTQGASHAPYSQVAPTQINFAQLLIPENIFYALTNNMVPAVVVFGLLLGIALMHLRDKQAILSFLDALVEGLTKMTAWVSHLTPIGTFLIIADRVGTVQGAMVKQLSTYLVLYILTTCLVVFWIFPRIVGMLTPIKASSWLKNLAPILLVAFTTNVVLVTVPFMIELIKQEAEKLQRKDPFFQDEVQGIVSIIFNLPLGSLFITIFIFFTSFFYHTPLAIASQVQLFLSTFLTSLGAVGLGSLINNLSFILDTLGLPLTAIDTFLATLPFTAGFQSMISVMEISTLSLLTAFACHKLLHFEWKRATLKAVLTCLPLLLFAFTFKSWIKLPPISNPAKTICDLKIDIPVNVKVYKPTDPLPPPRVGNTFDRILRTKVLRVGYNKEMTPFSFEATNGQLVGYDMTFAYQLAKDLQCDLELIPLQLPRLSDDLNRGLYDIAMSGISITEERLKKICFSHSYLESKIVFVVSKKFQRQYTSLEAVLDSQANIVVRKGSSYESLARCLVPLDRLITIDHYDQYAKLYPNDVLLRGEPQAISWTLSNPRFAVVAPTPPLTQDSLGYPVALGQDQMLCYLNQWLMLKKNQKFTDKEYQLWILGHTENAIPLPRRWSIIRNVLGWTEN
jgi:Na+/H+-dicarboxylate symporter